MSELQKENLEKLNKYKQLNEKLDSLKRMYASNL